LATRKYVDPNQAIYDGVLAHVPGNFFSGAAFEIPGAIGEALGSRRAQTGEQPVTKTLEVEQPKVEAVPEQKRQEPETIRSAAVKQGDVVGEGVTHAHAIDDLNAKGGNLSDEDVDQYYQTGTQKGAEYGFVTSTGRFVSREEAQRISGAKGAEAIHIIPQESAEIEPQPVTSSDQWMSGIRNKSVEERAARGEFDEVAPGQGYATEDLLAMGSRMKPEEVAQHVSNLVNGVGGDPVRQAAAVRAREAQLAAASNRASRVWEDDPANMEKKAAADQARDALSQFHAGPIAKMKNQWHGIGMSMQGELPFDLGTFNGQRDKWLKEVGSEPSPKVQEKMRKMAKDVRDKDAEQRAAQENLSKEIAEPTRAKRMREQDLHRYLDEVLKDLPCRVE